MQWLHAERGYTRTTTRIYLKGVPVVVRRLSSLGIGDLTELTLQDLSAAHSHFLGRNPHGRDAARTLEQFFRARGTVAEGSTPPPSPSDSEIEAFATYLRETCGLAKTTIRGHRQRLQSFLAFLRFDRCPSRLQQLRTDDIYRFLRQCARTNNRFSLQHIVAAVRSFLRWRHAQGLLAEPLHQRIDTPRVYRGELLPRAIQWEQVQALLASIERNSSGGHRDLALLYLAAAYGLRSGELVAMRLDDIDWQARTLRVMQTKTRQPLLLPLTDEAATVLIDYLREGRPHSAHRELFLHITAPRCPLQSTAVHEVLALRIRRSGLNLPQFGAHVLRHSFAMRLMQQGVSLKGIGDALGHRDIESTSVYLRLAVDDLREAAQPVPVADPGDIAVELVSTKSLCLIRPARPPRHLPLHFQSRLASSIQCYVDRKRTLGRIFIRDVAVLKQWDDFLQREYPHADRVRTEMFTQWASELTRLNPTTKRSFQRIVRSFLLFYARDHADTHIPDLLTFPKPVPAVAPRLISESEMGRVLAAARQLPPTLDNPLRAETVRIGLLLLFCCGLRLGELLRLRLGDIEAESTVLQIRLTKFHKSRLVPLSPSVAREMEQCLARRTDEKMPMCAEAFLMWSPRSSEVYRAASLLRLWHQLCASVCVLNSLGHPPRLHDLRHSFAVNALQRWYEQNAEVQSKLPHLATYLGHASAASTHYYLKMTPELRASASDRFHRRFAAIFPEGGIA